MSQPCQSLESFNVFVERTVSFRSFTMSSQFLLQKKLFQFILRYHSLVHLCWFDHGPTAPHLFVLIWRIDYHTHATKALGWPGKQASNCKQTRFGHIKYAGWRGKFFSRLAHGGPHQRKCVFPKRHTARSWATCLQHLPKRARFTLKVLISVSGLHVCVGPYLQQQVKKHVVDERYWTRLSYWWRNIVEVQLLWSERSAWTLRGEEWFCRCGVCGFRQG